MKSHVSGGGGEGTGEGITGAKGKQTMGHDVVGGLKVVGPYGQV